MSCDDKCQSVFNKLVNSVNFGVLWTSAQIKSACPPKKKKREEEVVPKSLDEDKIDSPRKKPYQKAKSPYAAPSQICPSVKPCCFIKMQDPCSPCCCEAKPKLPPCPPRGTQPPREPVCGCELCQKNPGNAKCCDKNKAFRDIPIGREHFEKA